MQSGRGRIAMLVGEPGIGKTRTAEELTQIATAKGFASFWGRCPEQSGAPPYWPWIQVIRSCITRLEPETFRRAVGANAGIVSEIVPDVATIVPDLEVPPTLSDPDSGRFRP